MADQPAVNWDALAKPGMSEQVGGPRTYAGSEAQARAPWRCPACGQENLTRALVQGCEYCGAGVEAAKHVGVDPIAKKPVASAASKGHLLPTRYSPPISTEADLVFSIWAEMQTPMQPAVRDWVRIGFLAGWKLRGTKLHDSVTMELPAQEIDAQQEAVATADATEEPPAEPEPIAWDPAGARDRTLIAALTFFKEQVMLQQPEEATTGEWLTAAELDELIAELKGPYA